MDIQDLIAQVEDDAVGGEPLDRLAAAMGVKADMDDLTDRLIGHFVDQARAAGCSWSEIGAAMGVTKQAAQQRHTEGRRPRRDRPDRPFRMARFTQRARNAVREANWAAVELGRESVDTEHLLLGIFAVPQSLAAKALTALGLTPQHVTERSVVGDAVRRERHRRRLPFTPDAKQVLELSMGEALKLGHNYIGTEHIALALLRVPEGNAAKVMAAHGIDSGRLAHEITTRLAAAS